MACVAVIAIDLGARRHEQNHRSLRTAQVICLCSTRGTARTDRLSQDPASPSPGSSAECYPSPCAPSLQPPIMDWTVQSLALAFLLCVLAFLGSTFKSIDLRRAGPTPTGKRRRNPDSKTFRVQGLPAKHGSNNITLKYVEGLVRKAYRVEEGVRISIGSPAATYRL